MPVYTLRCTKCEHQFEIEKRISESLPRKCPDCLKIALENVILPGGTFILKGSGWTPKKSK